MSYPYGPPGQFPSHLPTAHPPPHGSRLNPAEWTRANSAWRFDRPHPHGVPEAFPWGSIMWAQSGTGPLGLVIAAPEQPVGVAHRAAAELGVTHFRKVLGIGTRPSSRRTVWGAVAGAVPAMIVVGSTPLDALALPAGAAVGAATAVRAGRWSRVTRSRRPWRQVVDAEGAAECFPHLRWLVDLVEEVPDQADLVWGGVREVLWEAPSLQVAADPVSKIATALARTARARRSRDDAVHARPAGGPSRPDTGRVDDIAAGIVGALGFEEEVYRRVADEYDDGLERLDRPEPDEPA